MVDFVQFRQVAAVFQAGTIIIDNANADGLRITWDVSRTLDPEPDQGIVRIANLSIATRKLLQEERKISPVAYKGTLKQGWEGVTQRLFFADVYDMVPDDKSDPTTVWTEMRLGDGMEGYRDGALNQSIGDIDLETLTSLIAAGMEIVVGADARGVLQTALPNSAKLTRFQNGFVAMGAARDLMNELMGQLKLRWTILNGELQLIPAGRPVPGRAILMSPNTGMLNYTPARDGSIIVDALSTPSATPGRQMLVQDSLGKPVAEVAYRIQNVRYSGDTDTGAAMQIEARKALI